MKIAIIGNCQVIPIRTIIDASPLDVEIFAYETWRMSPAEIEQLGGTLNYFDAVISQPLISGDFGGLAKGQLQATCKSLSIPLLFIHNMYFDAIVPDCIYVGKMGNRVRGPVSDYHSNIVLNAYQNGESETECLEKLHNGGIIDVPSQWRASLAALAAREKHVDVGFVEELAALIKTQDSMHFFNHPKTNVLSAYMEKALSMLFEETITLTAPVKDDLAVFGSWPVYSWVSEKLGFDYRTDFFLKENYKGKMDFEEFISLSFQTYSDTPDDNLV